LAFAAAGLAQRHRLARRGATCVVVADLVLGDRQGDVGRGRPLVDGHRGAQDRDRRPRPAVRQQFDAAAIEVCRNGGDGVDVAGGHAVDRRGRR
jgi:hypothetical protein